MKLKDILSVQGTAVHRVSADTTLNEAVAKLVEHNVGSLVVVASETEGERPVGSVPIGDVVKAHHGRLAIENRFMKDYIQSRRRAGNKERAMTPSTN